MSYPYSIDSTTYAKEIGCQYIGYNYPFMDCSINGYSLKATIASR